MVVIHVICVILAIAHSVHRAALRRIHARNRNNCAFHDSVKYICHARSRNISHAISREKYVVFQEKQELRDYLQIFQINQIQPV